MRTSDAAGDGAALRVLGVTEIGPRRAVALGVEGGRFHTHVIGATGSGKSTLLANLALADMAAGRGARRHLRSRAHELTAAFGVYAGRNHLVAQHHSGARRRLERRVFGRGQVLGLSEVAALVHLPYDEMIPGLAHASAAAVAPPPGVLAGPWRQDSSGWEDDDAYI